MTSSDDKITMAHEDYHRLTVELLTDISEEQPQITQLLSELDVYIQVLVVYTSVMSTLLTIVALLILQKLHKDSDG